MMSSSASFESTTSTSTASLGSFSGSSNPIIPIHAYLRSRDDYGSESPPPYDNSYYHGQSNSSLPPPYTKKPKTEAIQPPTQVCNKTKPDKQHKNKKLFGHGGHFSLDNIYNTGGAYGGVGRATIVTGSEAPNGCQLM